MAVLLEGLRGFSFKKQTKECLKEKGCDPAMKAERVVWGTKPSHR